MDLQQMRRAQNELWAANRISMVENLLVSSFTKAQLKENAYSKALKLLDEAMQLVPLSDSVSIHITHLFLRGRVHLQLGNLLIIIVI